MSIIEKPGLALLWLHTAAHSEGMRLARTLPTFGRPTMPLFKPMVTVVHLQILPQHPLELECLYSKVQPQTRSPAVNCVAQFRGMSPEPTSQERASEPSTQLRPPATPAMQQATSAPVHNGTCAGTGEGTKPPRSWSTPARRTGVARRMLAHSTAQLLCGCKRPHYAAAEVLPQIIVTIALRSVTL